MTRFIAVLAAIVVFGTAWATAQTLADVARAEEARRKAIAQPSKVYTAANLTPDFTTPVPPAMSSADAAPGNTTPSGNQTPAAVADAGAPAGQRDQAYWSARMMAARTQLERSRTFADALQSRIAALTADFINRDDPAQRSVIEQDRTKALAELERVKKEMDDQGKAIAAIEDEARRAGVPPGWLR